MRLEKITIEGYRSLKSVEWKPESLNVLIGGNATGKSNFLHALELLPAAANGELKETIFRRGGMVPLVWDGSAKEIRFKLVGDVFGTFQYELGLMWHQPGGGYSIAPERLIREGKSRLPDVVSGGGLPVEAAMAGDHGELAVRSYLRSWSIFHDFRTDQQAPVRGSVVSLYEKHLDPESGNLVPLLFNLYNGSTEFEEELDEAMSAAFPNQYEKLKFTPLEKGRIELRVRWKNRKGLDTASDLSDGTLRFLRLLAILANPEPAPFIAIDEPETGLHPRMLWIVAELAQRAAAKSQVIFTTHSPQFLDAFEGEAPAVSVFEWAEGQTVIRTLEGEKLQHWLTDYSLGKFVFSGGAEAIS